MRGRSGYCSMDIKVLLCAAVLSGLATADPGLLKVPRIYNAYVTANEKLEPSHASPHAIPAVPVFQPVGGEPIDNTKPIPLLPEPAIGENGELIMPTAKQARYPETFYPRSVGYYQQPQPYFQYPYYPQPYQYSGYQVQGNPGIVNQGYGNQGVDYRREGNLSPGYISPEMTMLMASAVVNRQPTSYKSSNSAVVEMQTGGQQHDDREYDYEDA